MKKNYQPVHYIRSLESARSDLPSIQKSVNQMLRRMESPYECRLLPTAVVEVFLAADPLSSVFRHDANSQIVQLSKRSAHALQMPLQLRMERDCYVNDLLEVLIFEAASPADGITSLELEAKAAAAMMLEPVRRVAIKRREQA